MELYLYVIPSLSRNLLAVCGLYLGDPSTSLCFAKDDIYN